MGLVDLDDELLERPYTLRQLLGHTSGLADYGHLADYHRAVAAGDPPWPRDKVYDLILGKELLFRPGEGWSYSNVGYMLAMSSRLQRTSRWRGLFPI
jgi:CubicO group peptidase (beta-lactamase class C family)